MAGASKANQRQGKKHKGGYNAYRAELRHEKSHVRRISLHLLKFPGDQVAVTALALWKGKLKGYV